MLAKRKQKPKTAEPAQKVRYQADGFDLDLTYIKENIIAMGFPSGDVSDFADDSTSAMAKSKLSKVEALYRNPISEVVRFLDTKHPDTYKVYNLCSERLYDPENFHFMVAHFAFEDHNCPPLVMVKSFCLSAAEHLAKSPKHVVAVHCKAGKSRTGLMICALMMHLKLFPSTEQCIQFYNAARCHDLKGLTLASQRRYVRYYFHEMLHGPVTENLRYLSTITVSNCPANLSLFWRFRTHLPRDPYTSTRDLERKDECICNPMDRGAVQWQMGSSLKFSSDVCIECWCHDHRMMGGDKDRRLFYIWIHVGMVPEREGLQKQYAQQFTRAELDKVDKSAGFPSNFLVELGLKGSPTVTETYAVYPELILETALPNGSGRGGSFSDDFAAADPEGAAAVLSGVKSILAGGASFVSTGVNKLGSFATASAVDGGDDVDPLLGQPFRKAASVPLYALSDEERVAIEAEERSKSAAYAAVDLKSKTQKQINGDSILANLVDMGYDSHDAIATIAEILAQGQVLSLSAAVERMMERVSAGSGACATDDIATGKLCVQANPPTAVDSHPDATRAIHDFIGGKRD